MACAPLPSSPHSCWADTEACAHRFALVIGNATHSAGLPNLRLPTQDAEDVTVALQRCGFRTTCLENATRRVMQDAWARFATRLGPGATVVLYFSGHGAQVGGVDYVAPTDGRPEDAAGECWGEGVCVMEGTLRGSC